ncbi:MAG: ORF6N domain-containing protein [Dysgonamonadaceae bacterium]|jgi:hypothetical protein|nr:ORF6N domain-containing protein [Dysgonamonadaceae bacterium]
MDRNKNISNVENKVLTIREQQVILASDLAELYSTTTREINKAVRNNPDKFPRDYCFPLQVAEKQYVVENFHHLEKLKFSPVMPMAFTEKGLYMIGTILHSSEAVEMTFAIIETFAKLRELARNIDRLNSEDIPETESQKLQTTVSKMFRNIFNDPLPLKMRKTLISFNFGVVKISVETVHETPSDSK